MMGMCNLILVLFTSGATVKTVYFPEGKWYNWYNQSVVTEKGGIMLDLSTPVDHIQVIVC